MLPSAAHERLKFPTATISVTLRVVDSPGHNKASPWIVALTVGQPVGSINPISTVIFPEASKSTQSEIKSPSFKGSSSMVSVITPVAMSSLDKPGNSAFPGRPLLSPLMSLLGSVNIGVGTKFSSGPPGS